MNKLHHQHSPPFLEGCQPQADGVETNYEQSKAVLPPPKISNRTKGSPYTITLRINTTILLDNSISNLPKNIALAKRAKALRQARNLPEVLFWMQVTKGRFHQIDFDRQKVIGNFIVDFYVKRLGLIIEIDGVSHIGKEEYDEKRENYLKSLGLRLYRISTYDIKHRMGFVLKELEGYIIENFGERKGSYKDL